jgi:hypothetical protein
MCGFGFDLLSASRPLLLLQWVCLSVSFQSQWMAQPEALAALGISRATLHRLRSAGIILDGVHTYRCGIGRRAPLRVNVPACELALQVHTVAMRAVTAH